MSECKQTPDCFKITYNESRLLVKAFKNSIGLFFKKKRLAHFVVILKSRK